MTTQPATVTIPAAEYLDLIEADALLNELYSAGVDNWEGWDEWDRSAVREAVDTAKAKISTGTDG